MILLDGHVREEVIHVLGPRFVETTSGGTVDGSPDEVVFHWGVIGEYAPHEKFCLWWSLQLPEVSPPPLFVLGFMFCI